MLEGTSRPAPTVCDKLTSGYLCTEHMGNSYLIISSNSVKKNTQISVFPSMSEFPLNAYGNPEAVG